MALGSVSVPSMSKKAKERMMYMDGKLIWSTAMGAEGGTNTKAPTTVDYLVVRAVSDTSYTGSNNIQKSLGATEVRVARGGSAAISVLQTFDGGPAATHYESYSVITFASDGSISLTWPGYSVDGCISVEGYQYL